MAGSSTHCVRPGRYAGNSGFRRKGQGAFEEAPGPTFRSSPEVKTRLSPRRNDNNVYDRTFRAGNYLKLGWPSVNIMSSSDYKSVALTDYDRFRKILTVKVMHSRWPPSEQLLSCRRA
nr:phage terminase large subunit family protein [Cedecea sp. FDAARGOS_727]